MVHKLHFTLIAALALLGASPPTLAHDHGGHVAAPLELDPSPARPTLDLNGMNSTDTMNSSVALPQSYFTYPEDAGLLRAHIILMVISWFFILPIEVVLSIARSRLVLPAQITFSSVNGLGLLLGRIYQARIPDLYKGNMHGPLGWALSVILLLQCVIGAAQAYASVGVVEKTSSEEHEAFIPISVEAMVHHQAMHGRNERDQFRFSRDSGQGTEPEFSSSGSVNSSEGEPRKFEEDTMSANGNGRSDNYPRSVFRWTLLGKSRMRSSRMLRIVTRLSDLIDFSILPLGFVAIISGLAVYGGVFRGSNVFNGLAHTIKGGIFFWYGLLTLGRWMGCMVEHGWAWNVRPPVGIVSSRKSVVPSAEFVESFVIFLYGATNVFLEHLAAWGDAWTAQDLEHVSISIMFFGGGLCGMLIESQRIRRLLNATMVNISAKPSHLPPAVDRWDAPKTYPFSLNPLPALIILLLGLMMSSHHQASSVSTMIHKQWGTLFVAFALARALTYILTYITPPQSFLPSRPPTEIVTSFCLIAGGIIFMLSNKDTVAAMDRYDLNAMFTFTITMGFTAFLMAWTMIVLAVKGWAVEKRMMMMMMTMGGGSFRNGGV